MLTKNGNVFLGKRASNVSCDWIRIDGARFAANNNVSPITFISTSSDHKPYIAVGTGNTAPTVDDVNLEHKINTPTRILNKISNPEDRNSDFIFGVQTLYKNETSEDIVIKEIGIMSDYWNDNSFLFSREVLQTPIVIKPNKTYCFSIVI